MTDLIVYITSCGPNVKDPNYWKNLVATLSSLSKNIGDISYKFYIVVSDRRLESFTNGLFKNQRFSAVINQDALLEVVYSQDNWAKCYNDFLSQYQDKAEYILISHDDILVETPNFITTTLEQLRNKKDPIGWISFTNTKYQKINHKPIANSFKDPFAKDRFKQPCLFECHKFTMKQRVTEQTKELLDYPLAPVKAYGPYTHLVLVSTKSMKKIGKCSEWTDYTIFIDDDWNLASLKEGLYNVWVPNIFYQHPNPNYNYLRKPGTDLRFMDQASALFIEKWGFDPREVMSEEKIEEIKEKFSGTNVGHTAGRNTYEWDYLK